MSHGNRLIAGYRWLGYTAVWPAAYALGVYVLLRLALNAPLPDGLDIIYILLVGHACYLLDRVKVSDHRQDPADAMALPQRSLLYARQGSAIRAVLVLEVVVAVAIGVAIHPVLGAIPLLGLITVHLYAGRGATPGSPRFKDLPALKAFIVATGHLALAVAVFWAGNPGLLTDAVWIPLSVVAGIWLIVIGDATLCDIDDEHADRAFDTYSPAVLLGRRRAWRLAAGLVTLGSAVLVVVAGPRLAIGGAAGLLVISTLLTRANTNHRDFVDARLLPIVLIGMLAAMV
ncbi:MAG: hypothetical protein WD114_03160 [Phycisphaerales bacterium]